MVLWPLGVALKGGAEQHAHAAWQRRRIAQKAPDGGRNDQMEADVGAHLPYLGG